MNIKTTRIPPSDEGGNLFPKSRFLPKAAYFAGVLSLLLPTAALAVEETGHAGWVSILPPLIAISLALILRQVIPALFIGIWIGAWAAHGFSAAGLGMGLLDTLQVYVLNALADSDHAAVILFSMMIGGMVGIISRNGGMLGVVESIVKFASSVRRASAATVAMGLCIFFDDYANTLVVGNTMRPITDRQRISREKLAYLVDSTAAPVACVALVTTWVGYEVGLIGSALTDLAGVEVLDTNAYMVFLNSIPFSFYPLFALTLVFAVVSSGRDFGPMLGAEQRARRTGRVAPPTTGALMADSDHRGAEAKEGAPRRAINALLPVGLLVVTVVAGLFVSGEGDTVREIIGSAEPYQALMWGSMLGVISAAVLSIGQGILNLEETVSSWFTGIRSMLLAMVILVLAWSLSEITHVLGTAEFLVSLLADHLHPGWIPALVFILAAATAFATGTSWGTMGILVPLVVPLSWSLMAAQGMDPGANAHVLYASVAAVLGGAVWGDHCSPISDTTILSSMASQCDHIEHVRTQIPYALLAGAVAVLAGALPAGFGVPWWVCLPVGMAAVVIGLRIFGHRVNSD